MVEGLAGAGEETDFTAGVGGGGGDGALEGDGVDMPGTGIGGQHAAGREGLEDAQGEFLVAAEGPVDGGPVAGEGGRVEDNEIEGPGLKGIDEVEGVGLDRLDRQPVAGGIGPHRRHAFARAVHADHPFRPGAGGLQTERTLVAERVEHPVPLRQAGHQEVLLALVEVEPGLLPVGQVQLVGQPVNLHRAGRGGLARAGPHMPVKTLQFAHRGVVAENDLLRLQFLRQPVPDRVQAQVDRAGDGLHDEHAGELVDDEAGNKVGVGPDQAAAGLRPPPFQRLPQGAGQVVGLEGHARLPAEPPPGDLRTAVVDAAAERAAARVPQVERPAVEFRPRGIGQFVEVDPGMAAQHARTSPALQSEHRRHGGTGCCRISGHGGKGARPRPA